MSFTIHLDKIENSKELRDAFKNEDNQGGITFVYWKNHLLGVFVSSEEIHDIICLKVAERWAKNASILSDLHDRLADESPKPFST